MSFYLGCAVWSYPKWVGNFYPPKTPQKEFLRSYSQRLTAVEGNTTFYAMPNVKTVERWREETPSQFKFCLKFPKTVTHQGQLLEKLEQGIKFIDRVKLLGDRLGPLFLQLPPNYSPNFLEDLSQFLAILSQEKIQLSVEVRHPNWFQPEWEEKLNRCLKQQNIGRVILDTRPIYQKDAPKVTQSRPKPNLPLSLNLTTNFTLIRFISHPQLEYNIHYLQTWTQQINEWLNRGINTYFFVHCPIEEKSPFTARYFYQHLKQKNINLPALPWEEISSIQQLSLF